MRLRIISLINTILKLVERLTAFFLPQPTPAPKGEPACTKRGMWSKLVYYMLMMLAGFVGYFVLHYIFVYVLTMPTSTLDLTASSFNLKFFKSGEYTLSYIEWLIFVITFLSIALTPMVRYLPFASAFFDTLYCISVGYNIAFMYWGIVRGDMRVAVVTVFISIGLCLIPYVMFRFKKIVLPKFFSNIVYTLYWVLIMGSSIFRVLSFIPGIGSIAVFFYRLYNLPGAGEILLIGRIVIYFLFIFLWLENVVEFIKVRAPRKYEWAVSFHLMYTITILINYCLIFVILHVDEIMTGFGMLPEGGIHLK